MHTTTRTPRTRSLWSQWPATTISALSGLTALVLVVATSSSTVEEPADEEMTDEEAGEVASSVQVGFFGAEESKRAAPSGSKSGLYAMKGPKDAIPMMARTPGAASSDDSDVWGSIPGTEIGEAYGTGGLGLVGTGRGGGGTGEGTIGLGSAGLVGKGGSYDREIQSHVLTVGTVDDNADRKAYRTALERLDPAPRTLGLDPALWQMSPLAQRHAEQPGGLDVALVIDTTGSMGDELEYLKVELRDIAQEVSRSFPGVTQRWGLVVYRDHGDDYVTRSVDFRGIDEFVTKLGQQEANGGGDFPEAMDLAMDASADLSWRRGSGTARMVFLVADAPTHPGDHAKRFASAVLDHRTAGTAIYPVGASGVETEAEAELRLAAKVTGGQYIFLTNHSGVGGHHEAAKVDQYTVESLHAAMTRMIRGELGEAGEARVPAQPYEKCDATPMPTPTPTPLEASESVEVVELEAGAWYELRERLIEHFMFALSMALLVLAGMGFDTLLHRWLRR